jgi:DNA-binding XRE family transcriptional regulator
MNTGKKKRLERLGWTVGGAAEFLQLTSEQAALIDLKLALAAAVKELREEQGLTQTALAVRLGSSQSRVAQMEVGAPSVSLDLLIKSLLAIGARSADIAKWIKRAETTRAA